MSDRLLSRVLSLDFGSFCRKVFETVSAGDQFRASWHHQAIAWQLRLIELGVANRLIVNVPPRSLKSIIISIAWPAWLLGQDPQRRLVCISYAGELALKLARDCRRVMETDWYKSAFPRTRLAGRRAEQDYETTAGGGRFSTSVDGTLTGRGGSIVIIDDPMKSVDAYSEAARKSVLEFFRNTALSRLNDKERGSIVLVMQRLHESDLSGALLEAGGWDHLCLPAVALDDEAIPIGPHEFVRRSRGDLLQPDREGAKVLADMKAAMGSHAFSAQYLQQPVPATGLMVRREWLRFYANLPVREPGDRIVQSWDTATKEGVLNDFSACITALVRRNKVYVLDVFCDRLSFPRLKEQCIALAREWQANTVLIEDAASGAQLLQTLWNDDALGSTAVLPVKPGADKITRFNGQTARIEAGHLLLPEEAPWIASFVHEILGFPNVRHDDQADALAHLLAWTALHQVPDYGNAGPILVDGETGWSSDGYLANGDDDWDDFLNAWSA